MTKFKNALATCTAILLAAGCGGPSPSQTAASATTGPSPATSPAAAQTSPPPSAGPPFLLQAIDATGKADHDELVFTFGGKDASVRRIEFVGEVRADPSDRPVPLVGTSFLEVVFDGTLDTAPRESDPAQARKYTGPTRITVSLPVLKEVAVSGDFEFVLSFGVGLGKAACITAKTQAGPARLVLQIWHDRAYQPAGAV